MAVVEKQRSRRIVVVFGGGSSDTSVARMLASLVSESGEDITGVFLEDNTLFRLAELPFTTEVCRVTTVRRPLTIRELERQMKVQALRAEQTVRQIAEGVGSAWSFRKHRGRLGTALAESRDIDLLLIGAARRALASAGELRATARTVRESEVESLRPVGVLFDQIDTGGRALEAGIELADRTGRPLLVFLPEEAMEAATDVRGRLALLGPKRADIRTVPSTGPEALPAAVRRTAPAVLIVGAGETGFEELKIGELQHELRCPIVVVR